MTIKVQLKRSAVKDKVPTAADLTYGELALNYHKDSVALYTKLSDNTIKEITACNQVGMQYMGVANPAAAMPLASASLREGMIYVLSPAGTAHTSWTGIAGRAVLAGQMAAWEGTKWELFGSEVSLLDASETMKGIVELATAAEVKTGTDTVRAVTPAGLRAHYIQKNIARLPALP